MTPFNSQKAPIFHAHITHNKIYIFFFLMMICQSEVPAINQKVLEIVWQSKCIFLLQMMHIKGVVGSTACNKVPLQCYMKYVMESCYCKNLKISFKTVLITALVVSHCNMRYTTFLSIYKSWLCVSINRSCMDATNSITCSGRKHYFAWYVTQAISNLHNSK